MEVSSPSPVPAPRDQELWDELCGSGEDSQVAKAAFHTVAVAAGGCSTTGCSGCVGTETGAIPERDGNAEGAAEQGLRGEFSAPAGLCSSSPGPRRARRELSCPSLHKQWPPAPPRSRGEVAPFGEPLIGTEISGRFPSAPLSPDPVPTLRYRDALGGVWIQQVSIGT